MTDRDREDYGRQDRERLGVRDTQGARPQQQGADRTHGGNDERRTWSQDDDDSNYAGRGGNTPYGRPSTGVQNREGLGHSGGYGDQGGFGSQHGQGGYASPAQGSAYGQTGAEWGRSGYGDMQGRGGRPEGGRSEGARGGGQASGFGYPSYAAERDALGEQGRDRDYGFRGQGGGGAQWAGEQGGRDRFARGKPSGGTYGQQDYGRSAQRSQARTAQAAGEGVGAYRNYGGDDRASPGASGSREDDHDHEPHYRRWRDQQLAGHDQDYDRWRTEQARRYDDEYKSYRDTRHQSFTKEFGDWRNKDRKPEPPSGASEGANANASPSAKATSPAPGYGSASGSTFSGGETALQNVSDGGSGHTDRDADKKDDTNKA